MKLSSSVLNIRHAFWTFYEIYAFIVKVVFAENAFTSEVNSAQVGKFGEMITSSI